MPKLDLYLNKAIMVSIPSLFEDGRCRPFRLIGIELYGLWLEGIDLTARLLPEENSVPPDATVTAFVPFAQIACVIVAPGKSPPVAARPEGPRVPPEPPEPTHEKHGRGAPKTVQGAKKQK